jgi:glycosyltransferase involved in cell wall biosynthesis
MSLPRLSLVVPLFNEVESAALLVTRVHEALADFAHPWELILVDDGSTDGTVAALRAAQARFGAHVRIVELSRNFGQTAALQAGLDQAGGELIAFMDGDLQNDPADLPAMVRTLLDEELDAVVGWRRDRQDGYWLRKLPSRLANALIGRVTGIRLNDYGCTLKVFRAEAVQDLKLYGEMHRFIPAWIAMRSRPSKIREMPVRHHARAFGASKYGLSRTVRVLIDLLVVHFFLRYRARPGHFFGTLGLALGALGGLMLAYLFGLKLSGEDIGLRPLFLTAVLLVMLSVQLLTTGVLAEMLSRTYYASGQTSHYRLAANEAATPRVWHAPAPRRPDARAA